MSTLTGIKVLDFTRLLPGPYCTWLLSDLGADVTRVENPREVAKQARVFGWDKLTPDERQRIRQHDMLARDKRSIVLDIGHDRAKDVIHALAAQADVFVEDYRPGVLAGLGIGAEDLRRTNPALVTCSITLCGQTGPDRDRPGHDPLAMAMSGAMSRAGDRADRPSSLGLAVADILTGTNAALAISAALIERARTGKGKALDIAMSDAAMCLNANVLARHPDPETIPALPRRRVHCHFGHGAALLGKVLPGARSSPVDSATAGRHPTRCDSSPDRRDISDPNAHRMGGDPVRGRYAIRRCAVDRRSHGKCAQPCPEHGRNGRCRRREPAATRRATRSHAQALGQTSCRGSARLGPSLGLEPPRSFCRRCPEP